MLEKPKLSIAPSQIKKFTPQRKPSGTRTARLPVIPEDSPPKGIKMNSLFRSSNPFMEEEQPQDLPWSDNNGSMIVDQSLFISDQSTPVRRLVKKTFWEKKMTSYERENLALGIVLKSIVTLLQSHNTVNSIVALKAIDLMLADGYGHLFGKDLIESLSLSIPAREEDKKSRVLRSIDEFFNEFA